MKAFLLAAGLGTRLRPLTEKTPKPLLPVGGVPLIFFALAQLRRHGFTEIGINLHHLGEQIAERLGDGGRWGMRMNYFREEKLLGTGGAIRNAREFLSEGPFLLWNADTILDLDVAALQETHRARGGIATLAVTKRATVADFGGIRHDAQGRVLGLQPAGEQAGSADRESQASVFTGASILDPVLFEILDAGGQTPCVLRQGVLPAIARGASAWVDECSGAFADLGTQQRLDEANVAVQPGGEFYELWQEAKK